MVEYLRAKIACVYSAKMVPSKEGSTAAALIGWEEAFRARFGAVTA